MYTMTPDAHFLVDVHPAHENVCFAAGLSGHGFKFASALGEALSELALGNGEAAPEFLGLQRFG
jgi:glycine/D-amino acid oxidase-like deaminating enzyme